MLIGSQIQRLEKSSVKPVNNVEMLRDLPILIVDDNGGSSEFGNLAYACLDATPGREAISASMDGDHFVPLFNPQKDLWQEHFTMRGFVIDPLTAEGRGYRATAAFELRPASF